MTLSDTGAITGFAYTIGLNRETWRTVAGTRQAFFASLPERELAVIEAAPATALRVIMVAGATHLPGYDHVSAALRQALFPQARDRYTLGTEFTAYHLLTPDCPETRSAGLALRTRNIQLGNCHVDEWLLRFGGGGLIGWIGEVLGLTPAESSFP